MMKIDLATDSKNNPRRIKHIVVHCTATPQNTTIDSIERYWKNELKWKNPGYHYIVKPDGSVISMLPETLIANGVAGHNSTSIHISYIGGITKDGKPIDNRTPHQKNALNVALKILRQKYPTAKICGHRDFSPDKNKNGKVDAWEWIKSCPAFDAQPEYQHI